MGNKSEITRLLLQLNEGEKDVYDQLYSYVYEELKKIAYAHMSRQSDHPLSKTELVHETYLKMVGQLEIEINDRGHFLAIASKCMRQILIDYARKQKAQKRGGDRQDLTYIDELFRRQQKKADELIHIDAVLKELATLNKRLSDVVEMRFFGDMTIEDTAEALEISESTVKRDWLKARGWLYQKLR